LDLRGPDDEWKIMIAVMKKAPATHADLEALPDNVIGEIVDGELFASPQPAIPHAAATSQLGMLLGPPFRYGRGGPGGWIILDEPELHFGEGERRDVLVPDLAGWRRERMPETPGTPAISLAPDWVCEVLSPSTERLDRAKKMQVYSREQVGHLWLVDPLAQILEVYRRTSELWTRVSVHTSEDRIRAEPFEAIELELGLLWEK
jgi:Uma2 family endonuclease